MLIAVLSFSGVDVSIERARGVDARLQAEGRPQPRRDQQCLALIVYSVIAGSAALVVGAVVSLVASGPQRLTFWVAATSTAAVTAGVARESRLVSTWSLTCGRLLRRLTSFTQPPDEGCN
jgi:hypothetical protein